MKCEFVETIMADAAVGWKERGRTRAAMASGGGGVLLRRESIRIEKCMEIVGTIYLLGDILL